MLYMSIILRREWMYHTGSVKKIDPDWWTEYLISLGLDPNNKL